VAEIQQVIVETGALADLESTIARLATEAVASLDQLDLVGGARDELIGLAEYVSQRET
jgi:geranylgeranyl pyrophosphate synthase